MKKYVSIDIGGTGIKYGMIDEEGEFLSQGKVATEAHRGGGMIVTKVMGIVKQYQNIENLRNLHFYGGYGGCGERRDLLFGSTDTGLHRNPLEEDDGNHLWTSM